MAVVSAVIITRNRRDTLAIVLERLRDLPLDEILVVDNDSSDGTAEAVRDLGSPVRLLEPGRNLALGGRNLAAEQATGDYLLMLDDDAYPLAGSVESLREAFEADSKLGVAGGFVRDIDPEGNIVRAMELGTFDWLLRAGRTGDPVEGFPAFSFPEGACMIRRSAYLEVGGFFEPYFLASSEIDMTARMLERGWDVRYFPDAPFDHLKAESERQTADVNLYYRIRNHLWYIWLRFPPGLAVRRTAAYLTFDLIESTYRGVPGTWVRAVRDAWGQRDQVRGERRPLPRSVLRRAELNRGRMHMRLLAGQLFKKLRPDR